MHPETGEMSKIKIGTIKEDTSETQPHDIPKVKQTPKTDTRLDINSIHKYNNISRTKRVNHVTTFKNAPFFFQ